MRIRTIESQSLGNIPFYAVLVFFILCPLLKHYKVSLPWLANVVIFVCGSVYLIFRLTKYRRWRHEHRHVPRFLICFFILLVELAWENGMVWLVSASDLRKYDNVMPLQDNLLILMDTLAFHHPFFGSLFAFRWVDITHFLGAMLVLAFSVLWKQMPYSGFGSMSRVLLTVAASRVLRVACFMGTVLPSTWPGCYARRFPSLVPVGWWNLIKAGYTELRGFGGCNDLIFSGHGSFWVLTPLMFGTYYRGGGGGGECSGGGSGGGGADKVSEGRDQREGERGTVDPKQQEGEVEETLLKDLSALSLSSTELRRRRRADPKPLLEEGGWGGSGGGGGWGGVGRKAGDEGKEAGDEEREAGGEGRETRPEREAEEEEVDQSRECRGRGARSGEMMTSTIPSSSLSFPSSPTLHPKSASRIVERATHVLLWMAYLHASLHDVYMRQHYTVDMLLAGVVTAAVWTWLRWVYDEDKERLTIDDDVAAEEAKEPPSGLVMGLIAFALIAAAVIVIGGRA